MYLSRQQIGILMAHSFVQGMTMMHSVNVLATCDYRYELNDEEDQLGTGVACVVRASPESTSFDKKQLQCHLVNRISNRYPIGENEEVVSSAIFLKPAGGSDLDFGVCYLSFHITIRNFNAPFGNPFGNYCKRSWL
jgi:hypothetical protein